MGRFIFFARRAVVIITLFFLLGCESNKLSKEIRDEAKGGDLYSSDSIKTVSMTPVGVGNMVGCLMVSILITLYPPVLMSFFVL